MEDYFKVKHLEKDTVSAKMRVYPKLWEARPLARDLRLYAARDVIHLPAIYERLKSTDGVFKESDKCRLYPYINENHPGVEFCESGSYLAAFIK